MKGIFVLVLATFTLDNKRHRYSVFHVSSKDGRGLSDGYHCRFLLSIQWLMTNPHSPVECHARLGTYRRNTATRSLRTQTQLRLIFLFLEYKERNMCRFYRSSVYCWTLGCNILLPSLMSIVAHENGQRINY